MVVVVVVVVAAPVAVVVVVVVVVVLVNLGISLREEQMFLFQVENFLWICATIIRT